MGKGRLEAFSDGVLAIIITIMVLELKVPEGAGWNALLPVLPTLLSYLLSFVFVGIYWSNHHHLFQVVHHVHGGVLWANLHLLFWLSLIPFVTEWMGAHHFSGAAVGAYGAVLLGAGVAYYILARVLVASHDADSPLAVAIGSDVKGRLSILIYIVAIPLSFYVPSAAFACYVMVAVMWLVPDRRIERVVTPEHN